LQRLVTYVAEAFCKAVTWVDWEVAGWVKRVDLGAVGQVAEEMQEEVT